MSELFRQEAVEHATRRLTGDVILQSPTSARWLGAFLVLVVVVAVILSSVATYARRESVAGWIVPESGLIRVSARQGGIVEKVETREGAQVEAGAALVRLRLSTDVDAGNAGTALLRSMTAEAEATAAEEHAEELGLKERHIELTSRRAALVRERDEIQRRVAMLEQRQRIAEQQDSRAQALLSKGFVSTSRVDELRAVTLVAAQDASEARADVLNLQRQISDVDATLAGLSTAKAAIDAKAARNRAALAQRRTGAETLSTIVATAPIAGRVVAVPVELGESVSAGASVVTLTPNGSELIAELYAPSRAAGFINVGQEVRLMYEAFPYQTFDTGRGTIRSVSRTVLLPSDVRGSGISVDEPVFRVRVALDRQYVAAYGRDLPLQPGMLLRADVIVDRRSLLEWLLDPLYAVGRRG